MRCRCSYILFHLGFFFVISFALEAASSYKASICNNATTFSNSSRYSSNINTVIDHLRRNPSQTGYNTHSYGQAPNKAYGLLQCIGNISRQNCLDCFQEAKNHLQRYCGHDTGGLVWMDNCFLRYGNYSFISKLDTGNTKYFISGDDVLNDVQSFNATKLILLYNLSTKAFDPTSEGFAAASAKFSSSDTVYGLAQCWRDISTKDCYTCLILAIDLIERCCSGKQGAQAMLGSCTVRYDIYPFLDEYTASASFSPHFSIAPMPTTSSLVASVPSTAALPAMASTADVTQGSPNGTLRPVISKKKSSKKLAIALGIVGGVIVIVIVGGVIVALFKKLKSETSGRPRTQEMEERRDYTPESETAAAPIQELIPNVTERRDYTSESETAAAPIQELIPNVTERRDYTSESETAAAPIQELKLDGQILRWKLKVLKEATENFHEKNKLGKGGSGVVYKGTTKDGKDIAVKKLVPASQPEQENNLFMNELELVANIRHRNIVRICGYCNEGDERMIVYNYLPNKSLDTFLFNPEKRRQLDWEKRYTIILNIASGLRYLHHDLPLRIIHRDIKANNILLDEKLNAVIGDFGLGRPFPEDKSHIQTEPKGTLGYVAPEYLNGRPLTAKADVYSFGLLLLEILSGSRNNGNDPETLLEQTRKLCETGDALNMVDAAVKERCPEEQLLQCIHVGLQCAQEDPASRPTMSDVVENLNKIKVEVQAPIQALGLHNSREDAPLQTSTVTSSPSVFYSHVNETSVTELGFLGTGQSRGSSTNSSLGLGNSGEEAPLS
uniref:Protein kinase domain-containing protein n=1 Tax=Araucaria cunninghamii TaxID=56994 RepID=A0A0D6QRN6_ARACU